MSHKFIRPFGPTIYQGKLTSKEIEYLQDVALATAEARNNVGKGLAGNIKEQLGIVIDDQAKFMETVQPHLSRFMQFEDERTQQHLIQRAPEIPKEFYDNLHFDLGTGPWINYQAAHEFNPLHSHDGLLSTVVYIDVPEVIATEKYSENSHIECAGQIEFSYGTDVLGVNGTHKIVPQTGDFLIFHAGLNHTVYPFRSNVVRTSMSFNVMEIGKGE
jgi:hypothetical protein